MISETEAEGRLLRRGAAAVAGGLVIRLGARLLLLLIATLLYGAAAYGAFAIAVATIEICVAIGGLGMKKLLFRYLDDPGSADHPTARLADAAVTVIVASGTLAATVAVAFALSPGPGSTAETTIWLAPMIVGQSLLDLMIAATRWHRMVRHEVIARSMIEPYAAVAGALIAWLAGWRDLGLVAGYWAGTLAALLYVLPGVVRSFPLAALAGYRPHPRRIVEAIRGNATNVASDLVNAMANRFDLYIVGLLLGEAAAGVYNVARQVCIPLRQVRQSFDSMLTPIVSRHLAHGRPQQAIDRIGEVSRQILTLQLPLLLVMACLGLPALHLLGANFHAAYLPMLLLASGEIVQASFGTSELFFAFRAPGRGLVITAGSILLGLIASIALIGLAGLTGGAAGLLIAYSVRALVRRQVISRYFGLKPPLRPLVPLLAAALAAGSVAAIGKAWSTGPALAPALVLAVLSMGVFWIVLRVAGGRRAGPATN